MGDLLKLVAAYTPVIVLFLAGLLFVILIVFGVMLRHTRKLANKYKMLVKGAKGENLEGLIFDNTTKLRQVLFEMNILRDKMEVTEEMSKIGMQKVGLLRFDAFDDTGGELSYALALLNYENNGIVISSIFGRDDARTYCKYVQNGKSKQSLSAEEEKAIRRALGFVE